MDVLYADFDFFAQITSSDISGSYGRNIDFQRRGSIESTEQRRLSENLLEFSDQPINSAAS